jgi:hypothetical protein
LARKSGREMAPQLQVPEVLLAVIGADEHRISCSQFLVGFLRSYAAYLGHRLLLIYRCGVLFS